MIDCSGKGFQQVGAQVMRFFGFGFDLFGSAHHFDQTEQTAGARNGMGFLGGGLPVRLVGGFAEMEQPLGNFFDPAFG